MSARIEARFILSMRVDSAERLRAAAAAHPDSAGLDLVDDAGNVDIAACLGVLLDPGRVPGCSLHGHDVDIEGGE